MFNLNDDRLFQSKIKFISDLLFNQQNYVEENIFKDNI